ncbi:MAG: glycosyl hydrolase-related protein [Kiritimatiellae bacterium]|nr:glycosyl hydrolase-related protein [Kiritimatiellia bacterium]
MKGKTKSEIRANRRRRVSRCQRTLYGWASWNDPPTPRKKVSRPLINVYYRNHFDLIWRRGWKRSYEYLGLYYRSYADLEDAIISRCLKLATRQGAAFQVEQALSLREYFHRHPKALPVFCRLARAGRFSLLGAGEAIIDVNMCNGETMARNLASGTWYARETLGSSAAIANHSDGFGSSAQFPQVARLCGMKGIEGLGYCVPDGPYWRGLDGSTVLVKFDYPGVLFSYDHCYYEPCLACRGYGRSGGRVCRPCKGTGLRLSQGTYHLREWIEQLNSPVGRYLVSSEEMLPDEALPGLVAARNAAGKERYRWQTALALMPLFEKDLRRVDDPDVKVSSRMENNPTVSGVLVSRIRVKQAARQAEGWFYTVEKLAALTSPNGGQSFAGDLDRVWLDLPLLFFHDAITGTHNDIASQELLDTARGVVTRAQTIAERAGARALRGARRILNWKGPGTVAVFNPHSFRASLPVEIPAQGNGYRVTDRGGNPLPVYREPSCQDPPLPGISIVGPDYWKKRGSEVPRTLGFVAENVPPMSFKVFHIAPRSAARKTALNGTVEMGGYRLKWNDQGVQSIVEQKGGRELLNRRRGPAGHLILEQDIGDPWTTRSMDRPRTSCLNMSRCLGAFRSDDAVALHFAGKPGDHLPFGAEIDHDTFGLQWYQTVRLIRRLPCLLFDLEVFWQSVNHRLRVAFPSRSTTDRGIYKIPYGVLTRERYEMTSAAFGTANGDWPATWFAATEPSGSTPGLAVINTGTPSVRIENGVLLYSVLRSPGFGHCLFRYAQEYPMPTAEIRDGGHHRFRFALMPYTGKNLPEVLKASCVLNHPALTWQVPAHTRDWISSLRVDEPGVYVTAVKPCHDGHGMALRMVEQLGQEREVAVYLPEGVTRVQTANLLEETDGEIAVCGRHVRIRMKPYQIRTLLLRK